VPCPAPVSAQCVGVGWSLIKTLAARVCAFCTGEQVAGAAVVNAGALVRFPSAALVRQRARLAESLRGLITGE